jgi:surface polysaccharide O-acyltransferase-like enzyme
VPILQLFSGYTLQIGVFVLGGFVGYYLLGNYLTKNQIRLPFALALFALGLAGTIVGTWVMTYPLSGVGQPLFFFDFVTLNVIVASVALFILLSRFPFDWPGSKHPTAGAFVRAISNTTLPLSLFHVIILESLQYGFFGYRMDLTINPIIEIPFFTGVVFFITFGLVLLMKQVPILKRLIG